MDQRPIDDTQPARVGNQISEPKNASAQPAHQNDAHKWVVGPIWILITLVLAIAVALGSGYAGWLSAIQQRQTLAAENNQALLDEQFDLGTRDLAEGRLQVAQQRFEFILARDPRYPGASEKLATVLGILFATATPSPLIPTATITPTPTPDLRPIQERFNQAISMTAAEDWSRAIDLLVGLRKQDAEYQAAKVDGLLYVSLRQRGVNKIMREGNLEGGIYDLALAELFGPLDSEATGARSVARLYIIGSSFWEAFPEQAVYYFAQVAAAAPYLRDASGWTSAARYRGALVQYGDQLSRSGDWCAALEQYQLALSYGSDNDLLEKIEQAVQQCYPPTNIITATLTPTPSTTVTSTATQAPFTTPTPTWTLPIPPTATDTPLPAPTDTVIIPSPTETPVPPPPPTDTHQPTSEPTSAATP